MPANPYRKLDGQFSSVGCNSGGSARANAEGDCPGAGRLKAKFEVCGFPLDAANFCRIDHLDGVQPRMTEPCIESCHGHQ